MEGDSRRVPNSQRVRSYQKHRGWIRAKSCGFCQRTCHVDEMGVQAPPWRIRDVPGLPQHKTLTWYCCVQCAKNLDCSKPGWRFKAPYHVPYDCCVPDANVQTRKREAKHPPARSSRQQQQQQHLQPRLKEGPEDFKAGVGIAKGDSWADDHDDITFGSF